MVLAQSWKLVVKVLIASSSFTTTRHCSKLGRHVSRLGSYLQWPTTNWPDQLSNSPYRATSQSNQQPQEDVWNDVWKVQIPLDVHCHSSSAYFVRPRFVLLSTLTCLGSNHELHKGLMTGVVVDIGDGVTHICPVYQGFAMPHLTRRLDVAGREVTRYLIKVGDNFFSLFPLLTSCSPSPTSFYFSVVMPLIILPTLRLSECSKKKCAILHTTANKSKSLPKRLLI